MAELCPYALSCPPFRLLRLIHLFEVISSLSYSSRNVIFALSGSIYTVSARAKRELSEGRASKMN